MECGNAQGTSWGRWAHLFWWALIDIMEHSSVSHLSGEKIELFILRLPSDIVWGILSGSFTSKSFWTILPLPTISPRVVSENQVFAVGCLWFVWRWWGPMWHGWGIASVCCDGPMGRVRSTVLHPLSSADCGAGQGLNRVHQDLLLGLIHPGSLRFTRRMWRGAVSTYFSCPMWTERWRIRLRQDREEKFRERKCASWWQWLLFLVSRALGLVPPFCKLSPGG